MPKRSVLTVVISEELSYQISYRCNTVWDGYDVFVSDIKPAMPSFKFHAAKRNNTIRMDEMADNKHARTIATQISKAEGWHNDKNRSSLFGVAEADTHILNYVYKGLKKMLS